MYAIIKSGGKQAKVSPGDVIEVELLNTEDDSVSFTPILVVDDQGSTISDKDSLSKASVTAKVIAGQEIMHCNDCPAKVGMSVKAFDGTMPGACIAAPLMLDGVVYGALEFIRREPCNDPWGETEISAVGIIATLVTSLLGVFGQIDRLRKSESALLDYILDLRAGRGGCGTLT